MLEHLVNPSCQFPEDMEPMDVVNAQVSTLTWLDQLAARDAAMPDTGAQDLARRAYVSLTDQKTEPLVQISHVLALRAPAAVQHLVSMLTAYDWAFHEQASELRGYVVAKILEETNHTDAKVRLRALEMLGKVTEVGSFTDRIEINHKHEETGAIEERIRARLKNLLPPVLEVQDTELKDIAIVSRKQEVPE